MNRPLHNCPICRGTGDKNQADLQYVWAACPCTTDPFYFTKRAICDAADAALGFPQGRQEDR